MSWILALIMAAVAIGGGGLAHAADGAAPGDALYGLDRAMETLRLHLTTDPVESMELELAFAKERALEVGQTAGHGEPAHLGQALDNYGETIAAVAQGVGLVEGPAGDKQEAQLTQALAVHDRMLERAFDGEDGDQNEKGAVHLSQRLRPRPTEMSRSRPPRSRSRTRSTPRGEV